MSGKYLDPWYSRNLRHNTDVLQSFFDSPFFLAVSGTLIRTPLMIHSTDRVWRPPRDIGALPAQARLRAVHARDEDGLHGPRDEPRLPHWVSGQPQSQSNHTTV